MNILVLIKQTFDTEEKITIQQGRIQEDGVKFIINPYDEYAVEEAIKWKEELGGEVTVLSAGPSRTESALLTALAMGADKAVLIETEDRDYDEYSIAELITTAVQSRPFDLILAGNMAIDSGSGQVAIRVAEHLGIPHVSTVTGLSIENGKAALERDVEGDLERVEVSLPVLVTAQQGLNEPRYPSLPGIMKAKKKPFERITMSEFNTAPDGLRARTKVIEQYVPESKQAGRVLQGEIKEQVSELAQLLRHEAKVV